MSIQTINIELEQASSKTIVYTWTDPSTNLPINLTGYSAKLQIRNSFGDPTPQLELSTVNGGIILGGTAGTITVKFTSAQTTTLKVNLGFYDLFLTNTGNGIVTKFSTGLVYLDPSITALP